MKKLAVGLLTFALLTFGAGSAFGATDTQQLDEIKALTEQMFSIQAQIIDKQAEAGLIDKDQASAIKQRLEQRQKKMEEDIANGKFTGFGKRGKCGHGMRHQHPEAPLPSSPSDANLNATPNQDQAG